MKPKKGIFELLCGVLMLALAGVMAHAQSITVTSPSAGATFYKGQIYNNITWTKSGDMDPWVKIRLRDSTGKTNILPIEDKVPNNPGTNTYSWMIPDSVPPGNYRIRVRTTDNKYLDDSPVFAIAASPGASISVENPNADSIWSLGKRYDIAWTMRGAMDPNVKITLRDSTGKMIVHNIENQAPNNGKYSWRIPDSISPGKHIIRVETTDNKVSGNSAVFPIPAEIDLVVCLTVHGKTSIINFPKKVSFIVINRGKGEAPASILEIYVTNFGTSRQPIPALKPGEEHVWSRNYKWKTRGVKTIRAIIDPDNLVAESNENNNLVQIKERVRVTESYYRLEVRPCSDDPYRR